VNEWGADLSPFDSSSPTLGSLLVSPRICGGVHCETMGVRPQRLLGVER
jgi:hypothetical protein